MKVLFTKNDKQLGSFLIRWGSSDEPLGLAGCSHMMIVFDDRLVFQSTSNGGTKVGFFLEVLNDIDIVYQVKPKQQLSLEEEEAVYQFILSRAKNRLYDFFAVAYIGWRILLKKFFGKPLPLSNPFDSEQEYFCSELSLVMNDFYVKQFGYSLFPPNFVFSLATPQEVYEKLMASGRFEPIA